MFCQLAPGEQGDVVKLAGKAAKNRFIVAGPKMNPVDSASRRHCAIADRIKDPFIIGNIAKGTTDPRVEFWLPK